MNQLFTRKILRLSVTLPTGGAGTSLMMRASRDSTLSPVLALTLLISPSMLNSFLAYFSIFYRSQLASILLNTVIILSFSFLASSQLAMVCACTPWVASISSNAPWHPLIDLSTSQWKSTWPGVSTRFIRYSWLLQVYRIETVWDWTVMPRSRSTLSLSRNWFWQPTGMVRVISRSRSARVLLPWSMWAMMQKLRMRWGGW